MRLIFLFGIVLAVNAFAQERDQNGLRPGKFVFKGTVVDESGQSLNNIRVTVRRFIHNDPGSGSSEVVVHGVFEIAEEECIGAALDFAATGRDPVTVLASPVDLVDSPNGVVVKEKLRVVMERTGDITELKEFSGELVRRVDGSGVYLDLSKPPKEAFVHTDRIDVGRMVGPIVTIDADATGEQLYAREDGDPGRYLFPGPRPKNLKFVVKDGGIVVLSPAESRMRGWRGMKLAPEAGYEPSLIVNRDSFYDIHAGTGPFFFFKAGELYGKGNLSYVELSKDRKSIVAKVELRLQTNGSRNLATLR